MEIKIVWEYNVQKVTSKSKHILNISAPNKVNLKWKKKVTKLVNMYCRKDVRCMVFMNGVLYNLSCRTPKIFVANLAKIIIDNKPNKLTFDNISVNYVKY